MNEKMSFGSKLETFKSVGRYVEVCISGRGHWVYVLLQKCRRINFKESAILPYHYANPPERLQ
jgi:hypothetical protein